MSVFTILPSRITAEELQLDFVLVIITLSLIEPGHNGAAVSQHGFNICSAFSFQGYFELVLI